MIKFSTRSIWAKRTGIWWSRSFSLQDDQGNLVKTGERSYEEFLEILQSRFIMGDPDTVIVEIERYHRELEITELIFRIHFPDMPQNKVLKAITPLGKKVMPYFSKQ